MPLSKEFYLDQIKSKYPNSYNKSLEDLPVKDLEDMLDFLDEALDKADGGSIGIEVKIADEMAKGGRVGLFSGGALKGLMSLFKGGDKAADLAKQEETFRSGDITTEFLEKVDPKVIEKFIRTRDTKGVGGYGMYDSFDDMPNGLKAAELISRIKTADGGINYEAAELFIGKKLKGDETVDELIKMVIKKPGLTDSPLKDFENYVLKGDGAKDGGRVGLFMGGDPLTGQALQIYNSMKGYNFSDQEIADALSARGLYTPAGSGSGTETTQSNIIGAQLDQGGGGGTGIMELQETFTRAPGSTPKFSEDAFFGLGKFFQGKERGTLGTRLANQPRLPLPASIAAYSRSPFNIESPNYNPLLESQLNFAELGDNIVGMSSTGLKYGSGSVLEGKNVISGFGTNDYEKMLQDYISKMNAYQTKKATETRAAKIAKAEAELKALQAATEKARAAQYGATDYGRGSDGQRSYSGDALGDKDLGFGIGATTGGPVSNRTGRGRQDYSKGGLATMFTRRR